MTTLLDRSRVELKLGRYGIAPATGLADPGLLPRVQDSRRMLSARMYPLDKDDVRERIPKADYHVSRKIDGEYTVLAFRGGEAVSLNPGGTVRTGLPWLEEAAKLLTDAGVKEALVAGELYVDTSAAGRRPRVHDVTRVARSPESEDDLSRLRFAAFDLVSLDGAPPPAAFADTWQKLQRLFGGGQRVHLVEAKWAHDADGVAKLYHQWVEEQGDEGIVVRSDAAGTFKIKPRHTLDAAVIGFTESQEDRQGMLHDLLLAVMREDGALHVLTRVGGGFDEDQRRTMLSDLKDMTVDSEYAEVNSDHVAYQMVRPEWIVEISCLDMISQTTRGGPVNRMVLDWHANNGHSRFNVVQRLPLAAVISPQFVRRREDKRAHPGDISIRQVTRQVEVPLADRDARLLALPASQVLRREAFAKQLKGETMVRKFVLWKTNKETHGDEFPAYVLHYTDFSPNRQTPLAREVRVSSSWEQIQAFYETFKTENVKQGWELKASMATTVAPPPAAADLPEVATAPLPETTAAEPPPAKKRSPKMAPSEPAKPKTPRKKKSG